MKKYQPRLIVRDFNWDSAISESLEGTDAKTNFCGLLNFNGKVTENTKKTKLWRQDFKEPGQNFFAKASTTPYHGVRVVVENNGQILMTFLVAGFINSDVHKPIKARRSSAFKVFINPSANITNRMPFNPHQF